MTKIIHWTAIVLFCGAPLAGLLHAEAHWAWTFVVYFAISFIAAWLVDKMYPDPVRMLFSSGNITSGQWAIYAGYEDESPLEAEIRRRLADGDGA